MRSICCEAVLPGSGSKNYIVSLIFISFIFVKTYVFISPKVTDYFSELSMLLLIVYMTNLSLKVLREKGIDQNSKETILAIMVPGLDLLFYGKRITGIFVIIIWFSTSSIHQLAPILFITGYLLIYRRIFEFKKLLVVFIVYNFLIEIPIIYMETIKNKEVKIVSGSMEPTIKVGKKYLIKVTDDIEIGDIGAFKQSDVFSHEFVKRVVGVGGDKILLQDNILYVNDKKINEITYSEKGELISGRTIVIPENSVYVLGDNTEDSYDSRDFGAIDRKYLYGKIVKSLDELEGLK